MTHFLQPVNAPAVPEQLIQKIDSKKPLFFPISTFHEVVNGGDQCTCSSLAKKVLNLAFPIILAVNLMMLPFILAYNCCFAANLQQAPTIVFKPAAAPIPTVVEQETPVPENTASSDEVVVETSILEESADNESTTTEIIEDELEPAPETEIVSAVEPDPVEEGSGNASALSSDLLEPAPINSPDSPVAIVVEEGAADEDLALVLASPRRQAPFAMPIPRDVFRTYELDPRFAQTQASEVLPRQQDNLQIMPQIEQMPSEEELDVNTGALVQHGQRVGEQQPQLFINVLQLPASDPRIERFTNMWLNSLAPQPGLRFLHQGNGVLSFIAISGWNQRVVAPLNLRVDARNALLPQPRQELAAAPGLLEAAPVAPTTPVNHTAAAAAQVVSQVLQPAESHPLTAPPASIPPAVPSDRRTPKMVPTRTHGRHKRVSPSPIRELTGWQAFRHLLTGHIPPN